MKRSQRLGLAFLLAGASASASPHASELMIISILCSCRGRLPACDAQEMAPNPLLCKFIV
jgi:hypothetical protein